MEALRIQGKTGGRVSISNVAAKSSALSGGMYKVYATCDCWVKVGQDTTVDPVTSVTTSTGDVLFQNNTELYWLNDGDKFGIITSGTDTGTFGYIYVVSTAK